ncbi:hypothetical protein AMJ52_04555 [candidate division TA06 bacterium DG_78]|uniref:Bacterial transcriptional activator domain-containing protein n=1 Tax=candidate division TA06 bacterium DG_78 TaxID=1703772 RepID=A0A0S7YDS8_UNCT6|nr:MAG: hypothetical protein AMJ52_04555 [candidate division TA06 bacterium DG_78]
MTKEKLEMILLSKLQAPEIKTKTLRRERLLNLLSKNLNKKVISLCAAAGYGKTTLLYQFLSSKKIPNIYYHLEKTDAEPAVFLEYLVAGVRKIIPNFGKKTEGLSRYFNSPQKYREIIIGTFINEIIESIKKDVFIILEDYHLLDSSEQIDKILEYILEHLPPHLHFIITSRTKPSMSLLLMRARDELFELTTQHLRFTKDEIRHLFGKVYATPLKEPEIKWVERYSEGWPTSLRLILQSFDYSEDVISFEQVRKVLESHRESRSTVFNYFAEEIYNRESKEIQQFLIDCSVLEWVTPGLCDTVTGRSDSANILSRLTDRNMFLFRIPQLGYRFHNLFRNFLYSKLSDINRGKRIYHRAANFYSRENQLEEAVKFYLQAEEYDKAASIIERIGYNLIEQGKSAIICSYIEQIPSSIHDQQSELLILHGRSLLHSDRFDEAKNIFLKTAKMLKNCVRNRAKHASVLNDLGLINLEQGKLSVAKNWLNKALNICPRSAKITKSAILGNLAQLNFYLGMSSKNLSKITECFEKAWGLVKKDPHMSHLAILNNWAIIEQSFGNIKQAYPKMHEIVEYLEDNYDPHCGVAFFNAANTSLSLGYIKEAKSILDSGIKVCTPYNDQLSMASLWLGYARLNQELGDIVKAKQFVHKSLEIFEQIGIGRNIINAHQRACKIHIKAGDLNGAEKHLSRIWDLKKSIADMESISPRLLEAELRIVQGKFNESKEILLDLLRLAQKYKLIFKLFSIYIELCKVFYYQEKMSETTSYLKQALNISHEKGYDYLLSKELQKEKWMLPKIMRENIEKKYIMSIIKKSKLNIHWVDAFLFNVPRIFIDDYEIKDRLWETIKAKKLLFYLLYQKDEKITFDSIISVFWPNASHASARFSLRKARQHIRKAFKSGANKFGDLIEFNKDLYQITPKVSIALDTEEFQSLVTQAKKLEIRDGNLESCLRRAISIYKDGFAVGWYDAWVEELRQYYNGLYEECLKMLADFYLRKNKFNEVILWYKKLISLNFYEEEYHRKLMKAYAKLEKYKKMTQDFEKLKDVLKKELGANPQKETTNLFKSLIK